MAWMQTFFALDHRIGVLRVASTPGLPHKYTYVYFYVATALTQNVALLRTRVSIRQGARAKKHQQRKPTKERG